MRCRHCTELIRPCEEGPGCTVRCIHDRPHLLPGEQPGLLQLNGPLLACKGWVHMPPRSGWHLCDPFSSHIVLGEPVPREAAA